MNIFSWLFENLVYRPQLNLLQLYFNLTQDIGFAIVLVAVSVNIILWPLIVSSYISGQKMRLLQPKIKEIQTKYKPKEGQTQTLENTMAMNSEIGNFYKQHKINGGAVFQVLFVQLFFAGGLFYLISDVSKKDKVITGLYEFLFGRYETKFPDTAFGALKIDVQSTNYLWLPLLSLVLSFLYGMYSFKWAPKVNLPLAIKQETKPKEKGEDAKKEEPLFDPEAFAKTNEFNIIYVLPLISFFANASWSTGLNLYFATLSLFNLIRQIFITQYYSKHLDTLIEEIANSDPTSKDNNQDNDLEAIIDVEATQLTTQPAATMMIKKKKKRNRK